MPRPPLAVGTFGAINFLVVGKGRVRAQVSFRDFDGRRRSVTRYGRTKAETERRLRAALCDRDSGLDEGVSADSRLATVAAAWLAEVDDSTSPSAPSGCIGSPYRATSSPASDNSGCARSPCPPSTAC